MNPSRRVAGLPLATLSDASGSIAFGWLGDDVLYSCVKGGLSAELGTAYADRLQTLVRAAATVRYFSDARALESYDLLARSAFVRAVLADRRRYASITILTWREGVGAAARAFVATLGGAVDLLTDADEFERRLVRAAPFARDRLDAKPPDIAAGEPKGRATSAR